MEGYRAVWKVHAGRWLSCLQIRGYPRVGGSRAKWVEYGLESGDSHSNYSTAICLLPVMG